MTGGLGQASLWRLLMLFVTIIAPHPPHLSWPCPGVPASDVVARSHRVSSVVACSHMQFQASDCDFLFSKFANTEEHSGARFPVVRSLAFFFVRSSTFLARFGLLHCPYGSSVRVGFCPRPFCRRSCTLAIDSAVESPSLVLNSVTVWGLPSSTRSFASPIPSFQLQ